MAFALNNPWKVDMPLNKETKSNLNKVLNEPSIFVSILKIIIVL